MEPHVQRIEYQRKVYSTKQIRDCVDGSDAIKRCGELYLPMPSGMSQVPPTATTGTGQSNALADKTSLSLSTAPWNHGNPAYSAYIHRAKFPDMTSNTLRGLVGIATKQDPEIKLPANIAYLEELATVDGGDLTELYESCVSEVFQTSRVALVLDVRPDNTVYIAQYNSESYINWRMEVVNGKRIQTYAEFEDTVIAEDGSQKKKSLIYSLEAIEEGGNRICVVYHYTDGKLDFPQAPVVFQGKMIEFLPVVNISEEENDPAPGPIPLIGVSDCALDIYRHSADLNQAHFMTCNPTLVFIGVDEDDAPRVIGATVAICLSDPTASAAYLTTDTSALSHVQSYMDGVFQEAVHYGASLLGPTKRAAESAEALSLRQASSGATLVTVVKSAGDGVQKILDMATLIFGGRGAEFNPNMDFAELTLAAAEMVSLLNSWMTGGISHLSYLENMAAAGKIGDRTPEEEQAQIESESPAISDATDTTTIGEEDET